MRKQLGRVCASVLALSLVAAACGGDDDSTDTADTTPTEETTAEPADEPAADEPAAEEPGDEPAAEEPAADGEGLALEGEVEVAAGTVLNLSECPDDWSATQGVDGDEIRIGQSLPQSGPAAAFGPIAEGMQAYFDWVNENDPIADKDVVIVAKDDGYESGRTVANVEEMIDTEDIFAFAHIIGTPNNAAVRPITAENCIPQLFNATGFPLWGDPANYPWTIGNILNYVTETQIWCQAIIDEFGEGATVAALIQNSDFGKTYQDALNNDPACEGIEIVEEQLHDPAADTITNEVTTLIASDADVFISGTTGTFCPQSVGAVAASEWRPRFFMSYTCNNLASFFAPVQDAAAALAADGAGVRMTNINKLCGDPKWADDPAIQEVEMILDEYLGVTCADGSYSTGVLFAHILETVLRDAAAMPGGLNRVNLMSAAWNVDTVDPLLMGGTLKTDGVNDAYLQEAAMVQEVQVIDGELGYADITEVYDFEGQVGSFQG